MKKCIVEDCNNTNIAAHGMCWKHYRRMLRHNNISDPEYVNKDKKCLIEDCNGSAITFGYCRKHSYRLSKHGDPFKVDRIASHEGHICMIDNCNKQINHIMLCNAHYANYYYYKKKGTIDSMMDYVQMKNNKQIGNR